MLIKTNKKSNFNLKKKTNKKEKHVNRANKNIYYSEKKQQKTILLIFILVNLSIKLNNKQLPVIITVIST